MIYKKSLYAKIFRTKKYCCYRQCQTIFEDGDEFVIEGVTDKNSGQTFRRGGIYHSSKTTLFGDLMFCKKCYVKYHNENQGVGKQKEREDKKRVDYKILAEEICKILNKNPKIKVATNDKRPWYDKDVHADEKPECFGKRYSYISDADCHGWCKYTDPCQIAFEAKDEN